MMPRFFRPKTLHEALELLALWSDRSKLLAGGTDLIVQMRKGNFRPEAIIDLSALQELRGITETAGILSIGALATYAEIVSSPLITAHAHILKQAAQTVGSAQIRSLGTIGGNLAHASPAGDSLPPLFVLNAEVRLISIQGERWIPINDFFIGAGQSVRKPDELIRDVRFRVPENAQIGYFHKIGQRQGLFIAKASVAVVLNLDKERIQDCAIALGAVAPTVIRVPQAEEFLINQKLTGDVIRKASQLTAKACSPITDIRSTDVYRRHVIEIITKRGLASLAIRGGLEQSSVLA